MGHRECRFRLSLKKSSLKRLLRRLQCAIRIIRSLLAQSALSIELGAQVARRRRKLRRMLLLASGEAGVNSRKRLSVVFQQLLLARGRRRNVVVDDLCVAFDVRLENLGMRRLEVLHN